MRNLSDEGEAALPQDPRRSVVLGKGMRADGANSPAGEGVRDQLLSCFRSMAVVLVSGNDPVGNFHRLVRAGRSGKAAQPDDGVVHDVEHCKAVSPGISRGRSTQTLEELRGNLRSCKKISQPLSDPEAEAALVNISSLEKRAKMFRAVGNKANSLHEYHQSVAFHWLGRGHCKWRNIFWKGGASAPQFAIATGFSVYRRDMEAHDLQNLADDEAMPENDEQGGGAVFVLSNRPLVPLESQEQSSPSRDYENLGELPRSYGRPVLFGIARDPHTLFAYWEIDWPAAFGDRPPADRKVHLRVVSDDGSEETTVTVEPFAGNHCVAVSQARSIYRIELGYHEPADVWNSVATSAAIATPPDDVSENDSIDVATVPFHLSFQRMVDAFRASKYDGDALVEIVSRLQERADDPSDEALAETDRELFRAIDWSLSESDTAQRARLRKSADAFATRQRIESILGFGVSSRM